MFNKLTNKNENPDNNTHALHSFSEFIKHVGPGLSNVSSKVKFIIHQIQNFVKLTDEQLVSINQMPEKERFEILRAFNTAGSNLVENLMD